MSTTIPECWTEIRKCWEGKEEKIPKIFANKIPESLPRCKRLKQWWSSHWMEWCSHCCKTFFRLIWVWVGVWVGVGSAFTDHNKIPPAPDATIFPSLDTVNTRMYWVWPSSDCSSLLSLKFQTEIFISSAPKTAKLSQLGDLMKLHVLMAHL